MVELHREFDATVDESRLLHWHGLLMNGRRDLSSIGGYRVGGDPMRVESGAIYAPKVHFEAPPSSMVPGEMRRFMNWYAEPLPIATTACRF